MPRKVYRATAEIRLPGEKHKITVDGVEGEMDAIIDSDNEESRCGCPAGDEDTWWTARIRNVGDWGPLVAECSICGAAWVWGQVCATEVQS